MENFNNKERKNLFKRVEKMKKMQKGKNANVKSKSIQKLVMMSAVLVLIIMLILMVFRQNAIIISRQNPEYYRAMTYDEVQPGDEATNSEYVQFDAYFLKDINSDGNADKVRGTCNEIGTSDDLWMELKVDRNGYLKDAKITINSKQTNENGNFYFATEIAADSQIKNNYISTNTREIEFNTLENGTQITLSGKVNSSIDAEYHYKWDTAIRTENDYSKINSIVLTGTHVEELADGSTKETKIEKRVEFQVDWYGTLDIELLSSNNQTNDADIILDKEQGLLNIKFNVNLLDTKTSSSQLLFKTGHIEGILPEINGYSPTDIRLVNDHYGSTISYDEHTRKFTIEGNDFDDNDYQYILYIELSYPLEAYNSENNSEKSIEIPVKGWIEGYNNPNDEFQKIYKSNEVDTTLTIKLMREVIVPSINCIVGDDLNIYKYNVGSNYIVSKEKPARIYNGISETETEDYYRVQWTVSFSRNNGYLQNGVILKESKEGDKSDEFIKSDKSTDSMENVTTNVGIYLHDNLNIILGENGWIKVYNDDEIGGEPIVTFTKENWSQYNSEENMYKYAEPVKHIRIETSAIDTNSFGSSTKFLYVYNIKELDDSYITTKYETKEEFDNLKEIKSYVYLYTQTSVGEKEAIAYYIADYIYPITGVGMDLDDNRLYYDKAIVSTQQERDMKIRIGIPENNNGIDYDSDNRKFLSKWVDGEYLIKLPKDIIDLKINSITPDKENIQITSYETYEEEGNIYIKIKTKNETPENYQGKMTYKDTEVIYYYKLKESSITSTIEKTATANKVETQEDGTKIPVLTNERGQVTYNIKYNAEVNDYIGKVKIIVTDTLPAAIDETSSDLAGGIYDAEERTITWEEEVNVDTYTNGKYTHNFNKVVKLVYVDQDVTEDLVNTVNGETKIYYPDNYPEKGGEEVKTDEDEGTATVKQEYKVDKNVEKIWEDNNNSKGKRASSVMIELTADGEVVENSQVELNSRNGWKHTYRELEKYDEIGREIEYSIIETEKNPGDLEYYEEPEIGGTNDIIVTNKYKLKETALKSDITKETETVITASNQEVPFTIHYEAEIDEYIGDAIVTIVDELPYKIDEEKSSLDGGVYNEELQTITWTKELGHINTDTSEEAYKVDITKNIVLVYKDLDVTESMVTNKVKGTVELYETEEKNTVETEENTQVEVEGTVVVKYVEKETGKELETADEMTGIVGEEYITLAKDIEGYSLVGDTENTRGEYKEGTIEVIYYYEKTPAKVIIKYQDEEGNDLIPERVVEGYVSQEYETKAEEIEEYELKEVIGQEKGEMTKDDIVIIYVYKKKEAGGVIVHYIDKETGEKLAEDEVIEGNIGEEYKTERKVIENYQKAEPEPTNKEGTMAEETIEVTYYYERISSGKITVKYVDKETKEEITYEDDTGEEKTYGYVIKGYIGEEYKTEEKEIPYYKLVENMLPINREGILSQNDETVTYYYEKMSFNMEISKKVKTVTIKGEEKEVSNGSLTKVEIHRKEITTTPVEIRYVITVSNTGEIDGKGEVIEKIPEGFEVSSNNPSEWVINVDGTMKYAVELKAGESKDIEVVLKWQASETNFGEKKNIALIDNTENPAGFDEENAEDNKAEATVIVTVATGKEVSILIIVLGFIASAGSLILLYEYELYRKERNQPVRMVKLGGKNVVIKKEVQK